MKRHCLLGLVLLLQMCILAGCKKNTPQSEELLASYFSLLNEQSYDAMYDYLTTEAQREIDRESFTERYENIYQGIEASDIQVEIRQDEEADEKAETRRVKYTLSMETIAGPLSFDSVAIFQKDGEGAYKMDWDSQDIFPDLKEGEKVKVAVTPAKRGNIYDRNGVELAREGVASSVGIVPGKLPEDRDEAIAQIAEYLDLDTERIEKALSAGWVRDDTFVPVRTVSRDAYEQKEQLLTVPGVMITDTTLRYYPFGEKAAMVTGYVQSVTAEDLEKHAGEGYHTGSLIGKSGAEKIYEEQLRSRDGYAIQILTADGEYKSTVLEKAPEDGQNVTLTIDITLQQHFYQQMEGEEGCAAALNPRTGAVLALVSTPAFDPNDFVMGYTANAWAKINEDETQPLFNRLRASFVPGSVFKPVTAAMALTVGTLTPETVRENTGLSWQKDAGWGDYTVTTLSDYEPKNLENALIYSDNIFFAQTADEMGAEQFAKGLTGLGFAEQMPFEMDLTASSFGSEGEIASEIELADSGYGQGRILVNPLHLASIYSALVNEGNMIQPYLTEGTESSFWKEHVFSAEAAEVVRKDLEKVIEDPNGTAHEAQTALYTWGGKTGTAEIKDSKEDTEGTELGWFVGIQTEGVQEPLLAVMMIEDVKGRGGSHCVVPRVKACFDVYNTQIGE